MLSRDLDASKIVYSYLIFLCRLLFFWFSDWFLSKTCSLLWKNTYRTEILPSVGKCNSILFIVHMWLHSCCCEHVTANFLLQNCDGTAVCGKLWLDLSFYGDGTAQLLLLACDCTATAVHMWLHSHCCAHVTMQLLLCTYDFTSDGTNGNVALIHI